MILDFLKSEKKIGNEIGYPEYNSDYEDNITVVIGQNIEKLSGDFKRNTDVMNNRCT